MKSCLKYLVLLYCLTFIEGAFRCDYKYSIVAKGWFKHFAVPATWSDARLRCALEGAVLASPTTLEIKTEMTNLFKDSSANEIFTGIQATLSQEDYLEVTWAANKPDNKENKESCITLNVNGELAAQSCDDTRPYVCYHSGDPQVTINKCGMDPDYHLDTRTNKCYKFHLTPRNFSRASFTCAAEGGHLAIINSDLESIVLSEIFSKIPKSSMTGIVESWKDAAFIGFFDWSEHGDWWTVHGQTLAEAGFDKFNTGEPTRTGREFCGSLWRNGLLNDEWCDKNLDFICEKSPEDPCVCHINSEMDNGDTRPYVSYHSGDPQVTINECGMDPDYHLDTRTNKCYKFHLTPRNFSQASFTCAAEGGHLAIINSDLESTVLSEIFSKIPKSSMTGMVESWKDAAFIGFFDWGEHGDWYTVHGQTLAEAGFDKFNTGEPTRTGREFCGSVWRNGLLNDDWCDKNLDFICEKSPEDPGVCHINDA